MADNLTTVAPESTFPVLSPIASKQLSDGAHAGAAVIYDASGARTKGLAVNVSGQASVKAAELETVLALIEASIDAVFGAVDGLEGKDFATQTTLADALTALQLIDNAISGAGFNVSQINGVAPLMGAGNTGTGSPRVTIASDQAAFGLNIKPATTGGFDTHRIVSAATNNAARIKNGAGQIFGWYIYNSNAAARKVVLYNAVTDPPVPGTTTPKVTLVIPALSAANVFTETGIPFDTGIGIAMVTGLADSDNTAVAVNDLIVNVFWK